LVYCQEADRTEEDSTRPQEDSTRPQESNARWRWTGQVVWGEDNQEQDWGKEEEEEWKKEKGEKVGFIIKVKPPGACMPRSAR
jgi:collagenase-like PrtC family protease